MSAEQAPAPVSAAAAHLSPPKAEAQVRTGLSALSRTARAGRENREWPDKQQMFGERSTSQIVPPVFQLQTSSVKADINVFVF